jgi:hypothetical protein
MENTESLILRQYVLFNKTVGDKSFICAMAGFGLAQHFGRSIQNLFGHISRAKIPAILTPDSINCLRNLR